MPPKKRVKVQPQVQPQVEEALVEKLWEHYRAYLDSCDDNCEGDVDELQEIVELLQVHGIAPPPVESNTHTTTTTQTLLGLSRHALLPVLASMAHYQLAGDLISQTVDTDHDDDDDDERDSIVEHLQASLRYFPLNCATWSIGANYARIQNAAPRTILVQWYQKAAAYASSLRTQTLELLESQQQQQQQQDLVMEEEAVKEWLELLVLNGMLGVEYQDDEDENDEDEEGEEPENNVEKEEEEGFFSTSAVESTSRFMSAMLYSSLGQHDLCLEQLKYFDLTHRLHPRVWQQQVDDESSTRGGPTLVTGGVLPQPLYDAMCKTFAPNSTYWRESDYAHRGYHSYFFDIVSEPSNLIEEVIVKHLLPLAEKSYNGKDKIVGAEWWPHHRPIQANLGHNLHFDTDEALLQQEGIISHPVLSSVLYLTTGGNAASGPTIVFDQNPDSTEVATKCWTCVPQENAFLLFDGNLLHGVLPCPGDKPVDATDVDVETMNWTKKHDRKILPHRLTFMVGFWTRSVPDKIQNRKVYGPCGPLPPADSNEWVRNIHSFPKQVEPVSHFKTSSLPTISPAWEEIEPNTSEPLCIPNGINHRYFVKGAPQCFRDSLFEDNDEDADDGC